MASAPYLDVAPGPGEAKSHTVTKAEISSAIHEATGWEMRDIRNFIDLFCAEVKKALIDGNTIEIRGFGTFEIRQRRGRSKARNPRTGESVSVAAHGIAAFRPGRELKSAVWNQDRNINVENQTDA
jgi:integration host factor subunit beta